MQQRIEGEAQLPCLLCAGVLGIRTRPPHPEAEDRRLPLALVTPPCGQPVLANGYRRPDARELTASLSDHFLTKTLGLPLSDNWQ